MIRIRKTRYRETAVLIRVSWSPERKRSVQQVIGSFPADVDRLPPELSGPRSQLLPRERSQAKAWISARVAERRRERLPTLGRAVTTACHCPGRPRARSSGPQRRGSPGPAIRPGPTPACRHRNHG